MIDLEKISSTYSSEQIEHVIEKAYCRILFSQHYVFKVFLRNRIEYDSAAILSEFTWDSKMPFLNPMLYNNIEIGNVSTSVLVMNRVPQTFNVLYQLLNHELSLADITHIAKKILQLTAKYEECIISASALYSNFLSNLKIQISFLENNLSNHVTSLLNDVLMNPAIESVFYSVQKHKQAHYIHGNLFTGNIFYYHDQLIIIDPISYNHVARRSFSEMDIASYLTDIRILLPEDDFKSVFYEATKDMRHQEITLIYLYSLLKMLVRIRFAHVERALTHSTYDLLMNNSVIDQQNKLIYQILCELRKWLPGS